MNRFKITLLLWCVLLTFCIMCSNTLVNGALIGGGFVATLLAFSYIVKNMNKNELTFFNNLLRIFN